MSDEVKMAKSELLHNYGVRRTRVRSAVFELFGSSDFALSPAEIIAELGGEYDRVTVYRTLSLFLEKGLIHTAYTAPEGNFYALCDLQRCDVSVHHHDHLHFRCHSCGKVYCLESATFTPLQLPEGFSAESMLHLATGICNQCQKSEG
ncbi:MAG TPA: transcriptional repressor [Candidatus Marinimicrobia bacterium]|nr:transcriptional repressor [Candidatus Neomarinimicrobiota bacterium]